MEFYINYCNDFKGTTTFMKRVTKLIEAIMCRSPQNALKQNSEQYTVSYSTKLLRYGSIYQIVLMLQFTVNILLHSFIH